MVASLEAAKCGVPRARNGTYQRNERKPVLSISDSLVETSSSSLCPQTITMTMMLSPRTVLAAALLSTVHGLSVTTKPKATTKVFTGLSQTPLVRASDDKAVFLTDQWRSQTPFGLADEVAVVAFLRHFG